MARRYENLQIYNLAYDFVLETYSSVLPLLPEHELRNIYSQLQRAVTSIVLNIVEGASNRSNKVFLNHLQYSYGSCQEVGILLRLSCDLNYIDTDVFLSLETKLELIKAKIYSFMRTVDKEIKFHRENYFLN